ELIDSQEIVGGYRVKPIEELQVKTGHIFVEGKELIVGRQICGYMKEAASLALFVCTAGKRFSQLTDAYNQQGELLDAFVVDAIGSLTVENAMNLIQDRLEEEMLLSGEKITNRYSPGYCNWPLVGQQVLFDLLGENPVGVSLTPSSLMLPIKSVSGIIGIGQAVKKREYGCKICENKDCTYRKILKSAEHE
ncbi:hypothetical protein LJB84_00665, partial [Bacteroidales bacterium OttesenSCG-928-J19]|nr:hypothetical protein [Bacteroidales bacterium OttesenSCG-928-J19]